MNMKSTQIFYRLIAIAFLLLPATAKAEGFYVIGTFGPTSQDIYEVSSDAEIDEGSGTLFGFGKELNENLSAEFFSAKPTAIKITSPAGSSIQIGNGSPITFSANGSVDSSVTTIGAALKWHRDFSDNTRGFLKAGYQSWEVETTITEGDAADLVISDGTDLVLGLGAEYQINDKLALIIGYNDYTAGRASFVNTYLGVKFSF